MLTLVVIKLKLDIFYITSHFLKYFYKLKMFIAVDKYAVCLLPYVDKYMIVWQIP